MRILSEKNTGKKEMYISMHQAETDINFYITDINGESECLAFWITVFGEIKTMDGLKRDLELLGFNTEQYIFKEDGSLKCS